MGRPKPSATTNSISGSAITNSESDLRAKAADAMRRGRRDQGHAQSRSLREGAEHSPERNAGLDGWDRSLTKRLLERNQRIGQTSVEFLKDRTEELIDALEILPPEEKVEVVCFIAERLATLQRGLWFGGVARGLPDVDAAVEKYPGAKIADPLEWLEEKWGSYLRYFNSALEFDLLFQDDLRLRDEKLLRAVENHLAYLRKKGDAAPKLADVVPPKSRRIDREVEVMIGNGSGQEALRVAAAAKRRAQ